MDFTSRRPPLSSLLIIALIVLAAPLSATTYVMVADGDLADQAEVVAQVEVESRGPSPATTSPATDYVVAVERLLKGSTPGSTIVVRVPGGVRADGKGMRIWGAPEFAAGDRALLFLKARPDGSFAILHLMLGGFHVGKSGGRTIALRDLSEAREMRREERGGFDPGPDAEHPSDQARDLARFASWLADRAAGERRPADYFVAMPAGALAAVAGEFTQLERGVRLRWFDFDDGGSVPFYASEGGQPGLADGGFDQFQAALDAWNAEPRTPLRLLYAGTTDATGGLATVDGVNTLLFADPNREIDTPFSCKTGGILAMGAPWYDSTVTSSFNGIDYVRIQGADIVTNDGIGCFFRQSLRAGEELFGHELGHTLGLGHSCGDDASPSCATDAVKNQALMRAVVHEDGRGARLGSDDLMGIRSLYAVAAASEPTGVCRPSATALCLAGRRFRAEVAWQNQFDGSSGAGQALPQTDTTGFFSFGGATNVELLVKVLDFGDVVKVFYGQLTNLHFTLTLTDTRTGESKVYTNSAGDCGAIDPAAFTGYASLASHHGAGSPAAESCRPGRDTLCLLGGRFAVTVAWSNPGDGTAGSGRPQAISDVTGSFSFTDSSNVELLAKVVDLGGRLAVFYGSLTDLPYTLQVTDTRSGASKSYQSTAGKLCGGIDENAF